MTIHYACILEHLDVLDEGFDLSLFNNSNVQLNFYHGFEADHLKIISALKSMNITITSLHLPIVAFSDHEFMPMLRKVKELYGVELLTIHPSKTTGGVSLPEFRKKELDALLLNLSEIRDLELVLCIENFPSENNRWIYSPKDIYALCCAFGEDVLPLGITYDLSHVTPSVNIIDEFQQVAAKVKILHLSNRDTTDSSAWKVHMPYKTGELPAEELLRRLTLFGFDGIVVLEYAHLNHAKMITDYKELIGR